MEEGLTCQEICDKYHVIHADIYQWFDIEFDKFGRTPTRQQTEIAQVSSHSMGNFFSSKNTYFMLINYTYLFCQAIYGTLKEAEYLKERETEQLFSEALGKFLADRFVCGTCPKCSYEVPYPIINIKPSSLCPA